MGDFTYILGDFTYILNLQYTCTSITWEKIEFSYNNKKMNIIVEHNLYTLDNRCIVY